MIGSGEQKFVNLTRIEGDVYTKIKSRFPFREMKVEGAQR